MPPKPTPTNDRRGRVDVLSGTLGASVTTSKTAAPEVTGGGSGTQGEGWYAAVGKVKEKNEREAPHLVWALSDLDVNWEAIASRQASPVGLLLLFVEFDETSPSPRPPPRP